MKFYNTSILRGLMYEAYFPSRENKGEYGIRTHAPISRSNDLANRPLEPLE